MGIGSSSGSYYANEFHRTLGIDGNADIDNNILDPTIDPDLQTSDKNILDSRDHLRNLQSEPDPNNITEVKLKSKPQPKNQMPFPDNSNPDTDFNNRFKGI